MARTIVTLRVVLDFDPEDVELSEDYDAETDTPESYVRDALAGFLTNEINNCNEYPAMAYAEVDEHTARLEYLRGKIHAESISYGEIAELQGLAPFIDRGDVELLEWAGVPEHACPQCERTDDCECEVGIV